MRRWISLLPNIVALSATSACAAEPPPPPPPAKPLTPSPESAAAPLPDWYERPVTPGIWAWRQDARGSIALFGRAGSDAELIIRCDRQRGTVYVSRRANPASGAVTLTVSATSGSRTLSALPTGTTYVAVELVVGDPLLDAIGYSRGRFLVEGGGMPALVIPAWPEILRVTEDCRE